jgi:hypothetical protein
MADRQFRQSSIAAHRKNTLILPPPKLTFRELSVPTPDESGEPIIDKWIYVFIESSKELYAEIHAEKEDLWHVEYRPSGKRKAPGSFDAHTPGDITIDRKRLQKADYRAFLSPVRASNGALDLLKKDLANVAQPLSPLPGDTNAKGVPYCKIYDAFRMAEHSHREYLLAYVHWASYVSDQERQARLFIATTVDSWLADGDPAEIGKYLKGKSRPSKLVKDYEAAEKTNREEAEQDMVTTVNIMDLVEHYAIDLSTQQGGEKELAVGLLHWGIVSENMLCVAPGRIFANKLMRENKALPAAILLSDADTPNLYGAYATFKKAYEGASQIVLHLLAARVKQLRETAGSPLKVKEKIILYLRKLGLESELKGNYKRIQERLEAGDKISKRLKGTKRSSVITTYQKLVKKAGAKIPDYGDAQTLVDTANRLEAKQLRTEGAVQLAQVLFDAISLMDAIEDYRAAFPEDKDKKILAVVGAGGDVYNAAAELAERLGSHVTFLRITGGAAGFISGVVDMLDAEDKALNAAVNNNDYAAAVGHGITVVGASMTALAGGVLLVKGITGGAMFGGPFGAIVGAIGAGLMAIGMLVVAYFSDNDYQTFVRHCFLGKDSDTSVSPDWATVEFGGGSIMSEFYALYDLIYRYKVNFVTLVKVTAGLPHDTEEWAGLELIIHPQYGFGSESRYRADVLMTHDLARIDSKFEVKGLVLPDTHSTVNADGIFRRWSTLEVVDNMRAHKSDVRVWPGNFYIYTGRFTVTVQLTIAGMAVGKPTKLSGKIGGTNEKPLSSRWTRQDYEEHHIKHI